MRLSIIFLLFFTLLFADNLDTHLSFQGYTGLINTPNAQVIKEGNAVLHFNNQFDNHLRGYDYDKTYNSEENYIVGIGFLPSFEISGRLVESKGFLRDLSANIKYKIPFYHKYLPNIAIGVQDLGGSWSFYDNKYIVADKSIGRFRASLGYGKAGDFYKYKRMDGLFGGVEAKAFDWLYIMAEHDGKENHAGIRFNLPNSWINSFNLDATVVQNLTEADTSFAINVSIPLWDKSRKDNPLVIETKHNLDKNQVNKIDNITYNSTPIKKIDIEKLNSTFDLQKKLVNFGFEDVRVGSYGDGVIYVECENTIFDHNDLDALGYIIGSIANSNLKYNYYTVTLLKNSLQIISLSGTIIPYRDYIKNPTVENFYRVKNSLTISKKFDTTKVKFNTKKSNSSRFIPRFEFSPGLITTVGTEIGVLDYLVSLRSNLYMNLNDGLIASAMYEMPFANSDDFDKGEIYYMMYRDKVDSRLVNAGVHQTFHYENIYNTTTLGLFETDYYGILNQTYVSSPQGVHAFNLKFGSFNKEDEDNHNIYVGSYRYFYEPLELFTTISYGEYWYEDSGITLEFKRFFGDTAISFEYKNINNQYIGAKVSFPLTTRKLAKASKLGQIKGKKDFNYGIQTTIRLDDGTNRLIPSGGQIPKSDFEIDSYYLNRDRLNSSYILGHIHRMREAYLSYRQY